MYHMCFVLKVNHVQSWCIALFLFVYILNSCHIIWRHLRQPLAYVKLASICIKIADSGSKLIKKFKNLRQPRRNNAIRECIITLHWKQTLYWLMRRLNFSLFASLSLMWTTSSWPSSKSSTTSCESTWSTIISSSTVL